VSGDIDAETVAHHPGTDKETATSRQFTYGANGTLTGITTTHPDGTTSAAVQEYDPAGNLTRTIDGTTYTYNAANRQVAEITPTGEVITTGYWATGQRSQLTTHPEGGVRVTAFYWDGGTVINDIHSVEEGATTSASYLLGSGSTRHTRTLSDTSVPEYYTHDRHGNITTLTTGEGNPTVRYTYTDYGTPTATVLEQSEAGHADATSMVHAVGVAGYQPFQYAGEYTTTTGVQHLAAREYDPGTFRFTTPDTAQLHNIYAYGDLNPITNVDPTGHTAETDWTNWLSLGLGVLFGVLSIVAAIPSGGMSLTGFAIAVTSIGLLSDAAALALTATQIAADYDLEMMAEVKDFVQSDDAQWAGVVLGLGGGAAVLGVLGKATKRLKPVWEQVEMDGFRAYAQRVKGEWYYGGVNGKSLDSPIGLTKGPAGWAVWGTVDPLKTFGGPTSPAFKAPLPMTRFMVSDRITTAAEIKFFNGKYRVVLNPAWNKIKSQPDAFHPLLKSKKRYKLVGKLLDQGIDAVKITVLEDKTEKVFLALRSKDLIGKAVPGYFKPDINAPMDSFKPALVTQHTIVTGF
jgi:RHS repeat-associated protein